MCITFAKECQCGAITVYFENGANNSLPLSSFKQEFPNTELEPGKYYNCNYCINHWGTDLCACGCGEKIGDCTENYEDSNQPMQILGERKVTALWKH